MTSIRVNCHSNVKWFSVVLLGFAADFLCGRNKFKPTIRVKHVFIRFFYRFVKKYFVLVSLCLCT